MRTTSATSCRFFFPQTYIVDGCDMVSKYPVDEWIDRGATFLSATRPRRLAMKVAKNDMGGLWQVFQTAEQELKRLPSDFPEDKVVSDGAEVFAKGAAAGGGPGGPCGQRGGSSS